MDAHNIRTPEGAKFTGHHRFESHDVENCYNMVDQCDVVNKLQALVNMLIFNNSFVHPPSSNNSTTPFKTSLDRHLACQVVTHRPSRRIGAHAEEPL